MRIAVVIVAVLTSMFTAPAAGFWTEDPPPPPGVAPVVERELLRTGPAELGFVRDGQLWVGAADGSQPRPLLAHLEEPGADQFVPQAWLPDQRLLVTDFVGDCDVALVVAPDGGVERLMQPIAGCLVHDYAVSPDGSWIAVAVEKRLADADVGWLGLARLRGGRPGPWRWLVEASDVYGFARVRFAADGQALYALRGRVGERGSELVRVGLDDGRVRRIAAADAFDVGPGGELAIAHGDVVSVGADTVRGSSPAFASGGRLYVVRDGDVWLVSARDARGRPILEDASAPLPKRGFIACATGPREPVLELPALRLWSPTTGPCVTAIAPERPREPRRPRLPVSSQR